MTPIGNYFNKSNQASYIGTAYLLSVCCFTPLYGTKTRYRFASARVGTNYLMCRPTLRYPWSTRGHASGISTLRFVEFVHFNLSGRQCSNPVNRNGHNWLRACPLHGSTHRRQSSGWHGWRRVRIRVLDILSGKLTAIIIRIMTGNPSIYMGVFLSLTSRPSSGKRGRDRFNTVVCFPSPTGLRQAKVPSKEAARVVPRHGEHVRTRRVYPFRPFDEYG